MVALQQDVTGTNETVAADPLGLAETLAARLCHDLSGLAGTVMNTLELAEEEADGSEALAVASDAARQVGGRLRLLRAAWGGVGGAWDHVDLAELLSHAARFPRVRTDWTAVGARPFGPAMSRTLLNLALVGLESLPRGGTVLVAAGQDATVTITLDGAGARWPEGWVDAVTRGALPVAPESRELQPALALHFARADGVALSWHQAGDGQPPVLVVTP